MIATVWIGEDLLELLERLDPKIAELTTAVEDKTGRWPEELRLM